MSLVDGTSGVRASITITDGTGRLEAATGEVAAHRNGDEEAVGVEGRIDYDASNLSD